MDDYTERMASNPLSSRNMAEQRQTFIDNLRRAERLVAPAKDRRLAEQS